MGIYLQGYKTQFEKLVHPIINTSPISNRGYNLWSELMKHCDEFDFQIKSTSINMNITPIEYGTKFMTKTEKKFYNTFFYHTTWFTYDEEDESYINKAKYSPNPSCDDLGWLKLNNELYFRAFNKNTLEGIIIDFKKVDFDFIQEKFHLERKESQKKFSNSKNFNFTNFHKETNETFRKFRKLTEQIIDMYMNCISNKKDLIICYD